MVSLTRKSSFDSVFNSTSRHPSEGWDDEFEVLMPARNFLRTAVGPRRDDEIRGFFETLWRNPRKTCGSGFSRDISMGTESPTHDFKTPPDGGWGNSGPSRLKLLPHGSLMVGFFEAPVGSIVRKNMIPGFPAPAPKIIHLFAAPALPAFLR